MSDEKLLTTVEAASFLRMHPQSLLIMRGKSRGPRYLRPTDARHYLYRQSDLMKWLEGAPPETAEQRTARMNSWSTGKTRVAWETGLSSVSDAQMAARSDEEFERND